MLRISNSHICLISIFNLNIMKKVCFIFAIVALFMSCKLSSDNQQGEPNKELAALFDKYYEENLRLFPLSATFNGDNRYNDLLPVDFTDSYRDK